MNSDGGDFGLRVLDGARPLYVLPDTACVTDVLTPALSNCERFDLMAGYFSAAVLAEMSHGLANYLSESINPLRMLISPVLTDEDQASLTLGSDPESVAFSALESMFRKPDDIQNALVEYTKECLAYLVYKQRLELRVVVMKDGTFHPKQWTFTSGEDVAVLSGSANATRRAVTLNVEQLRLDLNWRNEDAAEACALAQRFFEDFWHSRKPELAVSIDIADAIGQNLLQGYGGQRIPTELEYQDAVAASGIESLRNEVVGETFQVPPNLRWDDGPFRHQGEAVRAWESNDHRGVLAIATGGGKTISSLVAAHRLAQRVGRLFVIVSAPTKPLVSQWAEEMREFGLGPYVQLDKYNAAQNAANIDVRMTAVARGLMPVDAAVITVDLLNDEVMKKVLNRHGSIVMFIGDEAHNLGSEKFISSPPDVRYRLALSATPERQYDPEGTAELFRYFGGVVYEFGLERAIGLCLTPYSYFISEAQLNQNEMDEYFELSEEIKRLYGRLGTEAGESKQVKIKTMRRRAVLESASSKISVLRSELEKRGKKSIKHMLIYATDKNPEQLIQVNSVLSELDIRFHQLTQQETSDPQRVAEIISRFRQGDIQVLTAKRVLDEGFNIPEISEAYVLASTTVERQWTQRRGRILRLCPSIGKTSAALHDIITMPPLDAGIDADVQKLVKGELTRVDEFAKLSENEHARDGARNWFRDTSSTFRVLIDRRSDERET